VSPLVSRAKLTWRHHLWGLRPFKRHGLVLLVAGVAYALIGVTYIVTKPTRSRREALALALHWFPMPFWGAIFLTIGLLAIISARWPPVAATWGYMLLTGLSAGWAATYLLGVMFEHAPSGNLTGTFNWGLLAFVWWSISGFVDPDKTVVVVIKDEQHGGRQHRR
jgi:hypothetical protein